MYIDYEFYSSVFKTVPESDFPRFCALAQRKLDNYTTGIDGFRKLKYAFPTDETDAMTVKLCMAELMNDLYTVDQIRQASVVSTESGVHSNVITSVSAGNESVHYASLDVGSSAQAEQARENSHYVLVRNYLSGVPDANGVNLLYMGAYPYTVTTK